ncbi:MAG: hypothetical protein ACHP7H_00670 [Hyphomicrobiales bacterium]
MRKRLQDAAACAAALDAAHANLDKIEAMRAAPDANGLRELARVSVFTYAAVAELLNVCGALLERNVLIGRFVPEDVDEKDASPSPRTSSDAPAAAMPEPEGRIATTEELRAILAVIKDTPLSRFILAARALALALSPENAGDRCDEEKEALVKAHAELDAELGGAS